MNYLAVLAACSYLVVAVVAQCPDHNCPPPTFPQVPCGVPDCSIPANRHHENALFPHDDPNYFWQCAPLNVTHWGAARRPCACGTVFNPFLVPPRCSFWYEEGWAPICNWQSPPQVTECPIWCPDCNGDGAPPGPTPPGPTPAPPGDDNNNCPCPCPQPPPCIWWPCAPVTPCMPVNNCPCGNRLG